RDDLVTGVQTCALPICRQVSLKAWEDFAQEPLAFPIGKKTYTVPPIGLKEAIRLERILSGDDKSLEGAPAEDLWRLVMGPVWDRSEERRGGEGGWGGWA